MKSGECGVNLFYNTKGSCLLIRNFLLYLYIILIFVCSVPLRSTQS